MALTGLTPIQITNLNVSGIATFEQAVGVGGTLTYQDVTNVDAVGIITARSGVNVSAGQLDVGNNIKIGNAGVATAVNFITGVSNLHNVGLTLSGGQIDVGSNIKIGNAGVVTATAFHGDISNATGAAAGLGTALSSTQTSPLNKLYYTDRILSIGSTVTIDHPASATGAYTQYADIQVEDDADLIVADGDDLIPDILGLGGNGTTGAGGAGRLLVDNIVNRSGSGAPTFPNGAVHSGISTFNDDLTLTGGSYNVVWDKSDNQLEFGDNAKLSFGGQADMRLWHDGTNSVITNATGDLYINNNADTIIKPANDCFIKPQDGENGISVIGNGAVELYFNNSKKIETTNTGAIVTGICTATEFVPTSTQLSHRNIIINGSMQVAQRSSSTTSSSGVGTVDRVIFYYGGIAQHIPQAQVDVSSGTTPYTNGFRKAFKVTNANQGTAGSDDTVVILYRIEAQDLANSGWNYTSSSSYITLSYWVKSSVQQNFYVTLKSGDGTTQKYATETGSLSANTWTKVTKTIPGNSNITFNNDNGEGLEIEWSLYRGTDQTGSMSLNAWAAHNNAVRTPDQPVAWFQTNGATFELTGVQLEVGSVATPFEHRSFGEELARCQRYCVVYGGDDEVHLGTAHAYNSTNINLSVHLPVPIRSKPSASAVTVPSGGDAGLWVQSYMGANGNKSNASISVGDAGGTCKDLTAFRMYLSSAHSGLSAGQALWVHTLANAKLILSAEV